jgi:hypothetical protein
MTSEEALISILRHDLAAAEMEIKECRKRVIKEALDLFKIEHMAKVDLERKIKEML